MEHPLKPSYLPAPPGWRYEAYPWLSLDDFEDLPELRQVGTVLLPEFFHLAIGTEGMWRSHGWPEEDDFALFLHFQVFEGRVLLFEARSAGLDLPAAYERVRKVVPASEWKRLGIIQIGIYLAGFLYQGVKLEAGEAGIPKAEHPDAALRWMKQLRSHAKEFGRSGSPTALTANKKRRKRSPITDEFLRDVAKVYQSAEALGEPPTRAVANHFDAPHSTAAKWVATARRKRFLPPTPIGHQLIRARGRMDMSIDDVSAVGDISPRLIQALERDEFSVFVDSDPDTGSSRQRHDWAKTNIRKFAEAVGLDPEPLIRQYEAEMMGREE